MRAGNFEGIWWRPEDPGQEVGGILEIDAATGGMELRLIGSFKDLPDFNTPAEYARVLGVVQGHLVTLAGLMETNARMGAPGYTSQRLMPRLAFFDGHLNTPDPNIRSAWLKFTHLTGWLEPPTRTTEWEDQLRSVKLGVTAPPEIECATPWGSLTLRTWEGVSSKLHEVAVAHDANVRVTFAEEVRYSEVERWVRAIQDLLTLAADVPNAIEEVQLEIAAESLEQQQGPFPYVDVTYDRVYQPPNPPQERHSDDFLFRAADLGEGLCDGLNAWLQASADLDSAINLHFSTRYAERVFLETRFLNAAQAVEVYHRRRFPNEVVPKAEHKARKNQILASAPAQFMGWLKGVLSFSNEKPFAHRLTELLDAHWSVMGRLAPDRQQFVREVVDVRNHFTHWTKKPKWVRPTNRDIFLLADRLGILIQSCLLSEVGFASEPRKGLFDRSKRYRWLADQVKS